MTKEEKQKKKKKESSSEDDSDQSEGVSFTEFIFHYNIRSIVFPLR